MTNEAKLLTIGQAANFVEELTGHRPSPVALWRWTRHGLISRGGERVRMAHLRVGAKLFVYRESVETFFRALAEADQVFFDSKIARADQRRDPAPTAPRSRSDKAKEDAVAKARRSLETATR